MQYFLIALVALVPSISLACGGDLYPSDILYPAFLYTVCLSIFVYMVIRLLPRFRAKGVAWATKCTCIIGIMIFVAMIFVVFQLASSSLCLDSGRPLPLPPIPRDLINH